ncbi:MAG: radical SAM protein [Candidatus Omnitrophica bacterium]|nr:radical SAM protein [Candidatus Omnitrophota bacterium]
MINAPVSVKPVPNYLSLVARNHARILNHRALIGRKIAIGRLIGVVESGFYPAEAVKKAASILARLQSGKTGVAQALDGIYALNKFGKVKLSRARFDAYLGMLVGAGHIEFHPTDFCDHECVGCYYKDRGNDVMPFEYFRKILDTYRPRSVVLVGGGEPTLYKYKNKGFADIVSEIKNYDAGIQIGVVTKGTHIPGGDWQRHIDWIRVSIDSSSPETFFMSKKRDAFRKVLDNYFRYLHGPIPHAGLGYLVWSGNIHETHELVKLVYGIASEKYPSLIEKMNIQFRPMRPGADVPEKVRKNHVSQDMICAKGQVEKAVEAFEKYLHDDTGLSKFILNNTNWEKVSEGNGLRAGKPFDKCYYCMSFRIFRPTGEVYPCFVRVSDPEYLLGNFMDPSPDELLKISLLPFLYFNKLGAFCSEDKCRMAWLNNIAENGIKSGRSCEGDAAKSYFF